jgi:hypothetical protein
MGGRLCRDFAECESDKEEDGGDDGAHSKGKDSQFSEWDDESSFHRRSAMNSLHNYALGKTIGENVLDQPKRFSKKSPEISLQFAENIEHIAIDNDSKNDTEEDRWSGDIWSYNAVMHNPSAMEPQENS